MKILFIHNDNLPLPLMDLVGHSEDDVSFESLKISQSKTDRDEYDSFLTSRLKEGLKREADLLVLPVSLGADNPLEFSGIRCAAHVRLDSGFKKERIPILFLSPLGMEDIMRLSDLGAFMLTPGVFLSAANTKDSLLVWLKSHSPELKAITDDEYVRFMDRFSVPSPANFGDDHHSIANQWGASVLSRRITREDFSANVAHAEALDSLYFKYVLAKSNVGKDPLVKPRQETEELSQGKRILLVDDEADRGWRFVLSRYLNKAAAFDDISQKVSCFEDFSEENQKRIVDGDYDLVFLDLRLNGADEESVDNPNDFSGMSVLKKIKSINPGIQVIMFTASNKVWNLKALLDAGADGYYVKQSPQYYTKSFDESNFDSFKAAIHDCLNRCYLKDLYKRMQTAIRICASKIKDEEFSKPIDKYFKLSFSLLAHATDESQYSYAFLALFGVIEELVKFFIPPVGGEEERLYYFNGDPVNFYHVQKYRIFEESDKTPIRKYPITNRIISIYMEHTESGLSLEDAKRISNFVKRRHNFVHNDLNNLPHPEVVTSELGDRHAYQELFRMVEDFIKAVIV